MYKKFTLVIVTFLLSFQFAMSQQVDLRLYLSNIVQIGKEEFGFIVGAKGNTIYFINATTELYDKPLSLTVHFYRTAGSANAVLVKKFTVNKCNLYLYAVNVSNPISWKAYSYSSIFNSNLFYSYIDNGKEDSVWYINSSKIYLNDKITNEIVQLKMPRDDQYYRGMPVIGDGNRIVGLIAEEQNDSTRDITFLAIDMQTIQKKLDEFSRCTYFQLIAYGQTGTPCEIEQKLKEEKRKEQKLASINNQIYPIAVGPAFSVNYNLSTGPGEAGVSAFGFSVGSNIYISPDKGRFGLTLKPRFTYSPLGVPDKYEFNSSIGFRPKSFRIYQLESPIMVELITKRNSADLNSYIGFGYSPGYQFPLSYRFNTTAYSRVQKGKENLVKGFIHKAALEFGWEGNKTRISVITSYQITPWHDPYYSTNVENEIIRPTSGASTKYLLIGIDLAFRLNGSWGLKSK